MLGVRIAAFKTQLQIPGDASMPLQAVQDAQGVTTIHKLLEQSLEQYARIQVHLGKTQVWNRGGHVGPGCQALQAAAERVDPDARVWRVGGLPSHEQGIRVLGIPVSHVEFVQAQLVPTTKKHETLYQRIQSVQDLFSAWLLLLFFANTCATCSFHPMKWLSLQQPTMKP